MTGLRRSRLSILVVSAVAAAAACGGGTVAPTLGPGGGSVGPGATSGPGGGPGATGLGAPTDTGFSFNFSLPPQTPYPPVGGKARVVNLYDPLVEAPFALDVVQTGLLSQSKPLLAVQPGAASEYFDPGDSGNGTAELSFYRAGSTKDDDLVMQQGWSGMNGRQITVVVMTSGTQQTDPNNPSATLTQRALGAAYVVEERGGTNPRPTVPAGQGVLWFDTQPLNEIPSGKGWTAPAIGTGNGTCLTAIGDTSPAGYSFIQGQQAFAFPPGPVTLNVYDKVSNPDQCKGTPAFGPINATIQAGSESVVIFYGLDGTHVKTLSLPIAP